MPPAPPPPEPASLASALRAEVRRRLREDYLPKLRRVLERLDDQQIWWRPNESSNSIANLLLHLEGNVRQWILHGVGGAPERRRRAAEFAERGPRDPRELLSALEATVAEALRLIETLPAERWLEPRVIQGYSETVLSAVLHVVEHFSGHVGQVLFIAKQLDPAFPPLYGPDGSGGP